MCSSSSRSKYTLERERKGVKEEGVSRPRSNTNFICLFILCLI